MRGRQDAPAESVVSGQVRAKEILEPVGKSPDSWLRVLLQAAGPNCWYFFYAEARRSRFTTGSCRLCRRRSAARMLRSGCAAAREPAAKPCRRVRATHGVLSRREAGQVGTPF